jgi:4-hydroxymandelate oxidase
MTDQLISLADYELAAEAALDPGAAAYYFGGAADEVTLRSNTAAWGRLVIHPRMLVGVGSRDPSMTVLGAVRRHPLIVAPMAVQGLAHRDAELATAAAAAATGSILCLSTFSTSSLEDVAAVANDNPRWFQLYVFNDRGITRELVARAEQAGYEALVVTVDLPVRGFREREARTPISSELANAPTTMSAAEFTQLIDANLRWDDIATFAAETPMPVIVKGLLTPYDAQLALEHGAAGVIVSNHGGRQLDTVLPTADALPAIVDAVGDQLDVIVDGGIRRGTDVLKALALGARAVLVGRPVLCGLAVAGASGAQRVLEILLTELDAALALAGAPRASELDRTFIGPAPWA